MFSIRNSAFALACVAFLMPFGVCAATAYDAENTNAWFTVQTADLTASSFASAPWTKPTEGDVDVSGGKIFLDTEVGDPLIYTPTTSSDSAVVQITAQAVITVCETEPSLTAFANAQAALAVVTNTTSGCLEWLGLVGDGSGYRKWQPFAQSGLAANEEYQILIEIDNRADYHRIRYSVRKVGDADYTVLTAGNNDWFPNPNAAATKVNNVAFVGTSTFGDFAGSNITETVAGLYEYGFTATATSSLEALGWQYGKTWASGGAADALVQLTVASGFTGTIANVVAEQAKTFSVSGAGNFAMTGSQLSCVTFDAGALNGTLSVASLAVSGSLIGGGTYTTLALANGATLKLTSATKPFVAAFTCGDALTLDLSAVTLPSSGDATTILDHGSLTTAFLKKLTVIGTIPTGRALKVVDGDLVVGAAETSGITLTHKGGADGAECLSYKVTASVANNDSAGALKATCEFFDANTNLVSKEVQEVVAAGDITFENGSGDLKPTSSYSYVVTLTSGGTTVGCYTNNIVAGQDTGRRWFEVTPSAPTQDGAWTPAVTVTGDKICISGTNGYVASTTCAASKIVTVDAVAACSEVVEDEDLDGYSPMLDNAQGCIVLGLANNAPVWKTYLDNAWVALTGHTPATTATYVVRAEFDYRTANDPKVRYSVRTNDAATTAFCVLKNGETEWLRAAQSSATKLSGVLAVGTFTLDKMNGMWNDLTLAKVGATYYDNLDAALAAATAEDPAVLQAAIAWRNIGPGTWYINAASWEKYGLKTMPTGLTASWSENTLTITRDTTAQTYVWTGLGTNDLWTTCQNWSPSTGYPGCNGNALDTAVFAANDGVAKSVTLPSDIALAAITVGTSAEKPFAWTIFAEGSLTVNGLTLWGELTFDGVTGKALTLNALTATGSGKLAVANAATLSVADDANLAPLAVAVAKGTTLSITAAKTLTVADLALDGACAGTTGTIAFSGDVTLNNTLKVAALTAVGEKANITMAGAQATAITFANASADAITGKVTVDLQAYPVASVATKTDDVTSYTYAPMTAADFAKLKVLPPEGWTNAYVNGAALVKADTSYAVLPDSGKMAIDNNWVNQAVPSAKSMTTAEVTEELNKTNAHGVAAWQAYAMGYEAAAKDDAKLVAQSQQIADDTKFRLSLGAMPTVRAENGYKVNYRVTESTTPDFTVSPATTDLGTATSVDLTLPSSGVKYYRYAVEVAANTPSCTASSVTVGELAEGGAFVQTARGNNTFEIFKATLSGTPTSFALHAAGSALADGATVKATDGTTEWTTTFVDGYARFATLTDAAADKTLTVTVENLTRGGSLAIDSYELDGQTYAVAAAAAVAKPVVRIIADSPNADALTTVAWGTSTTGANGTRPNQYRLPALAQSDNCLIALYDIRYMTGSDLGCNVYGKTLAGVNYESLTANRYAPIDIGESVSTNAGAVWSAPAKGIDVENATDITNGAANVAFGAPDATKDASGACVAWDQQNDTFVALVLTGGGVAAQGAGAVPYAANDCVAYTRPDTQSGSWTKVGSVREQIRAALAAKAPSSTVNNKTTGTPSIGLFASAGSALATANGVYFPMRWVDGDAAFVFVAYTTDGGTTWQVTGALPDAAANASLAMLDNGKLVMMTTATDGASRRFYWTANNVDWYEGAAIAEAAEVVQGALVKLGTATTANKGVYAAAYAAGANHSQLTIHFGLDDSASQSSWTAQNKVGAINWSLGSVVVYPGALAETGACSLVMLDATTLGIAFEADGHIYFEQMDVSAYLK